MSDLKEKVIDFVSAIAPKRDAVIEKKITTRYGEKITVPAIYSDKKAEYDFCEYHTKGQQWTVSTASNFAKLIQEELKRHNNTTGNGATVKLTTDGGLFVANDAIGTERNEFRRALSQQWIWFKKGINRTLNHSEFLEWFRGLKPSVMDFEGYFKQFAQLRIIGTSELCKNPYFVNNEQQQGYRVTYTIENCVNESEEFLPSVFFVTMPYEKGNKKTYTQAVELLFSNNDGELEITVYAPDYETTEEQAIVDEANTIQELLKEQTDLLVLPDFY